MTLLKWGVLAFGYLFWGGASFLSGTSSGVGIFAVTAEWSGAKDRGVMFFSSQIHQRGAADGPPSPLEWGIQEWEHFICRIRKLEWKMSSTTI